MPRQIANRTIFTGDNLPILRGFDSETADLVYLDPPFNSNRNYSAPVGSAAAGAEFKDTWTLSDTDEAWFGEIADRHPALYSVIHAAGQVGGKKNKSYLIYMAVRLLEMARIMKSTASIYYHCDPTMSHPVKMMMDAIFGKKNWRNEVVWCYTGPSNTKRHFPRKTDSIHYYVKDAKQNYPFNGDAVLVPYKKLATGKTSGIFKTAHTLSEAGKIPENWWPDFTPVGRLKRERTGYPTQKPLALMKRIISASSNAGDVVLDPFCGCATTCVAAEALNREWVGIDIAAKAAVLIKERMRRDLDRPLVFTNKIITRTDLPKRSGQGKIVNKKEIKHVLFGRQQGICRGCKHDFPFVNFTIDHRIPRAKGGQDTEENLQLLCGYCNSLKGAGTMEELLAKLKK